MRTIEEVKCLSLYESYTIKVVNRSLIISVHMIVLNLIYIQCLLKTFNNSCVIFLYTAYIKVIFIKKTHDSIALAAGLIKLTADL